MKALLSAIQAKLRESATLSYVQDRSIIITPDEYWLPNSIVFPAISIKDGGISNEQKLSQNYMQNAEVMVISYQQALNDPEQLVTGQNSVLDMSEDIKAVLIDQALGFADIQNVFVDSELPSENFQNKEGNRYIQKKTIVIKYTLFKHWT